MGGRGWHQTLMLVAGRLETLGSKAAAIFWITLYVCASIYFGKAVDVDFCLAEPEFHTIA